MFSVIATLQLHGLNPRAWLTWYFNDCRNENPPSDPPPYLPWNLPESRLQSLLIQPTNTS